MKNEIHIHVYTDRIRMQELSQNYGKADRIRAFSLHNHIALQIRKDGVFHTPRARASKWRHMMAQAILTVDEAKALRDALDQLVAEAEGAS